jgi:hypothetical protein
LILDQLLANGYRFVTLRELLTTPTGRLPRSAAQRLGKRLDAVP